MATVYCPGCGARVSGQTKFCENCGSEILHDGPTAVLYQDGERTCRLKLLLVLILGCAVWIMQILYRLFITGGGAFLLYFVQMTALIGAMIFHHTLKNKAVPTILACTGLLAVLSLPFFYHWLYNISLGGYLAGSWGFLSTNFLMAVLLLLYTILGKKSRNNIVWMLIHLTLVTVNLILSFRFNIFSLILTFHMTLFYVIGYSPDKWWQRRTSRKQG